MRGRVPEYVAVCQSAGQYVRPTVGGGGRLGVMPAGEPCPNGMSCSLLCSAVLPGILCIMYTDANLVLMAIVQTACPPT